MTKMRMAALATGLLAIGQASLVAAQGSGDPTANWSQVALCAKQTGSKARHACLDQLLRDKGLLDAGQEVAEAREAFGRSARAEAAPPPPITPATKAEPLAPKPSKPQAAAPAETKLSGLQTKVAAARLGADRKLLVTTSEGAIWHQTETLDLRSIPQKGDAFAIEEASLGSHRCTIGKSKVFRCQRIN
jgi:hypothetical protein